MLFKYDDGEIRNRGDKLCVGGIRIAEKSEIPELSWVTIIRVLLSTEIPYVTGLRCRSKRCTCI